MSSNPSKSVVIQISNPSEALEALKRGDHGTFCCSIEDPLVDLELHDPEIGSSIFERVLKTPKSSMFIETCAKRINFTQVRKINFKNHFMIHKLFF